MPQRQNHNLVGGGDNAADERTAALTISTDV